MRRTGAYQVVKPRHLRFVTLNLWGENGPWGGAPRPRRRQARGRAAGRRRAAGGARGAGQHRQPGRAHREGARVAPRLRARDGLARPAGGPREPLEGPDRRARLSRAPAQPGERGPHRASRRASTATSARRRVHTTHLAFREHEGAQARGSRCWSSTRSSPRTRTTTRRSSWATSTPSRTARRCAGSRGSTTLSGRRVYYQDAWDMIHPTEPGYTWAKDKTTTASACTRLRCRPPPRLHLS